MKKLYLLTDAFPYGMGEKTFIIPELDKLVENYQVCIISSAPSSVYEMNEYTTPLDNRITVVHRDKSRISRRFYLWMMLFWFQKGCWREVKVIVSTKDKIMLRIWDSMQYYARAQEFYHWINKNNIIQDTDGICYSYWYKEYLLGILLHKEKFPNLKIITRTHGYDLYDERVVNSLRQPFKKLMDSRLDKVIFASEYGMNYYLEKMGKRNLEKYTLQRLGAPKAIGETHKEDKGDILNLVSCSNVIGIKRVTRIIETLNIIEDMNIHWVHIGTGQDFEMVQEYASELLSKKGNITYNLKGYLTRNDIYSFYSKNTPHCFITLSETEGGCPVSIQEAMAYGIPVIGTASGGIGEMIMGNGILLSSDPSVEEVRGAIETMYFMDEKEYQKMSRRSYELWNEKYNQEKNVRIFLKLLERI